MVRGVGTATAAVVVTFLLVLHRVVPNTVGHLGSLLETFLPWLGLSIPVLAGLAWWRRSVLGALAALLPLAAWLGLFGGHFVPREDRAYDLVAVQHNVSDENADPAGTVRELLKVRPDLIALEELTPAALPAYAAAMPADYAHHTVQGTVGLWSRYPLTDARPVDIRPHDLGTDWNRGLRATAITPRSTIAIYVAHLPSIRLGPTGLTAARRDESAVLLDRAIAAEPISKVILLGDLNTTMDDRMLRTLSPLTTARSTFAFTWPAKAPIARIDQIMGRNLTITELWPLPPTPSDHLPIAAHVRL